MRDVSREYFERPLGWLLEHVGVPIASATPAPISPPSPPRRGLAPLAAPDPLHPRPSRTKSSLSAAGRTSSSSRSQPKYHLWYPKGSHNDIVEREPAAAIVVEFFRNAKSIPVI